MSQRTPLYNEHVKQRARIVDFAGFEMPVQYSSVVEEHNAVRKAAGLFDVSHMGEFEFTGLDALSFLEYLTPNNVSKLTDGTAQYSMLCNEQGGIVDDILVYRYGPEKFVMVVNASNISKDWQWIQGQIQKSKFKNQNKSKIQNVSENIALIALQGPKAAEILQPLTDFNLTALKTFHFYEGAVAGLKNCTVARTGYTGEDGFEIFSPADQAAALWQGPP